MTHAFVSITLPGQAGLMAWCARCFRAWPPGLYRLPPCDPDPPPPAA
ncbi:MAG: hypothetical protein IM661_06555 [Phenylobacterium sp.]|nr:hypothetical protein [Phenylobacterium sp.]